MADKNKNRQFKTLLSTLANGSEIEARKLLKKHTGKDAENTQDLEVKLARLYAESTSKPEIEREFVTIHPHKAFILKYASFPKSVSTESSSEEEKGYGSHPMDENRDVKVAQPVKEVMSYEGYLNATGGGRSASSYANASGHAPCGNPNCPSCKRFFYEYSNCGGNSECNCNKMSNACGCGGSSSFNGGNRGYSYADASQQQSNQGMQMSQQTMIIGAIAMIGILGLFMHMNKSKG